MATDFNYNSKTIGAGGPFKQTGKDMPVDARTRVNIYADIESIPNPYVGMVITVLQDENNGNVMKDYKVKSLKANSLGVANTVIDEVVPYADYLGVSGASGEGLTTEQAQQLQTAYLHSQSTHVQAGDIPTKTSDLTNDSGFLTSIPSEYITDSEMSSALSTKANTSDIPSLNGYATETFVTNKIAEASLSGGEVDLSGYATKDDLTSKVDKVEGKSLSTNDLTNELKSNYDEAYLHSQSTHVQASDIPSLDGYATENFVTNKIAEAQLGGGGVDTTSFATDLSLTGSNLQLKNSQGNLIGNAITLPSTSGGASETVTVVRDIYANNEMPKMYVTSDRLGSLASKADGAADCEVEIRFNRQIIKCYATGAVQGTSSASLPAKNYTFKFYSDAEHTTKNKIDVGWGKQSKYCFKKNYVDSTHTRNISGARIAYDMVNSRPESDFKNSLLTAPRNGAVDGFPCKVYLNGEFWGLYTWNIPKDPWMFNMSDDNPAHMVLCAEYNNNGNNSQNNTCEFRAPWGGESDANWSIEVGTYSETLKNSFNNAISHVMNSSDENFKANFGNYFDLYSMLDYYCFSYLTAHIDGLGKNMLMATYDGVHWGACLYDMDSIYGADWDGKSFKSTTIKCPEEYQETNSLLWQRIVTNFSQELYDRYFELRNGALSLGNIINHVEEIYDLVPDRVFNDDRQKWTGIPSQTTNTITRFRNYMRDRAAYCDERFKELILDKSVTAVSINGNSEVKLGSSITLTANLTPSIANIRTGSWSVNNANVTLNDSNGLSVVVNGSVLGSSTITFTSDDTTNGTISATHDINVVETSSGPSGDYEAELILQPVMAGKTWTTHSASTSSDCTGFECQPSFTYFDFPEDTSSMDTSYMYCSESIPVVTESEKKTNNIPCVAGALDAKTSPWKEYITLKLSNSDASNLNQLKTYLTNNITTLKVNMKSEVLKYTFNMDNITISTTSHLKPGYVCGEFTDNGCPITTKGNNVASASFMAGLPSNQDWSSTTEYSYFKITDWNGNRYIGFQIAENLLETQDVDGIKKFISKNPTLFYVV